MSSTLSSARDARQGVVRATLDKGRNERGGGGGGGGGGACSLSDARTEIP
eukprot:COSAG02_NODE_2296_length_9197_cov_11.568587_4_plen_50_part_00